jgi:hypothetical protein
VTRLSVRIPKGDSNFKLGRTIAVTKINRKYQPSEFRTPKSTWQSNYNYLFQVRDGGSFRSRQVAAATAALLQDCLVKLVPIIKIVQVHRIFECRNIVRDAASSQNSLASFVVMIVAADCGIVLFDGVPI